MNKKSKRKRSIELPHYNPTLPSRLMTFNPETTTLTSSERYELTYAYQINILEYLAINKMEKIASQKRESLIIDSLMIKHLAKRKF